MSAVLAKPAKLGDMEQCKSEYYQDFYAFTGITEDKKVIEKQTIVS